MSRRLTGHGIVPARSRWDRPSVASHPIAGRNIVDVAAEDRVPTVGRGHDAEPPLEDGEQVFFPWQDDVLLLDRDPDREGPDDVPPVRDELALCDGVSGPGRQDDQRAIDGAPGGDAAHDHLELVSQPDPGREIDSDESREALIVTSGDGDVSHAAPRLALNSVPVHS